MNNLDVNEKPDRRQPRVYLGLKSNWKRQCSAMTRGVTDVLIATCVILLFAIPQLTATADIVVLKSNIHPVDDAPPAKFTGLISRPTTGPQELRYCQVRLAPVNVKPKSIIDFRDQKNINDRRPILVAHRGGVVSATSPECSFTAIRRAANEGYAMVELDVQMSKDGVPIVFHDRSLAKACGKEGSVEDFNVAELESIKYLMSDDRIARLEAALELCRQLKLGVMLDLKAGRDSDEFLFEIHRLLEKHELVQSTITFSGSETARRVLKEIRFTPTDDEMRRLRAGEKLDLRNRFWFGLPNRLLPGDVEKLKAAGALIIPAINTFRYPADRHLELAKEDVRRLTEQDVDGFQIDSVYARLFSASHEPTSVKPK